MIIFLIILTICSLIIINIGIIGNKKHVKNAGMSMFIIVILMGWLVVGVSFTIIKKEYKTNVEIIKTKTEIIVKDTNQKYIFEKKLDFDNITDTTTFYICVNKNIYGFLKTRKIYYKIKDIKIYSK